MIRRSKTFLEEDIIDLKNIYDSDDLVSSLDSCMCSWFSDFVLFFPFISNKFQRRAVPERVSSGKTEQDYRSKIVLTYF